MKGFLAFLIIISAVGFAFAVDDAQVLEFKSKIGFVNGEEKIKVHEFFDNERKMLIIGEKTLQIWDAETGKLLNSAPHQIPQFAPRGFVSDYLLLSIPKLLDWRPILVDKNGRWLITVEKVGNSLLRSAVVRDLGSLKQIAVLDLPNVSIDDIAFDKNKNEIMAQGKTDKTTAFANWNADNFQPKQQISIDEYKWHQLIYNEQKMIVGAGDTKILWVSPNRKEGDNLTLRDVKTGAIEKEYTANNLKPKTAFQETTVSADEKYLFAKRDDRIFVWEIAGDGSPKFEISNPNPKGSLKLKRIVDKKFIVVKIDEQLCVYDIEGSGQPKIAVSNPNPKEGVSFKDIVDNKFLIAKVDEQLRVYDIQGDGTPFFELAPATPKENIKFSGIIKERLIVVRVDKKLRVYDAKTKTLKLEIVADDVNDTVEYRDITDDNKYIVVYDDRKISVFDLDNGAKPLYSIVRTGEKERFPLVRFLNDRKLLVVARVNRSEKKEPRTEFYEIPTGKLAFDALFEAGYNLKFTPDGNLIYQTNIGSFEVWNISARKYYSLKLKYYSPPSRNPNDMNYSYMEESPYNTEFAEFNPDYRYVLRYDGDVTSVFDAETGTQLQNIFDSERVKYDKKTNQIKSSGLDEGGWINQGRYVYALASGGIFGSAKTVSFWKVKK